MKTLRLFALSFSLFAVSLNGHAAQLDCKALLQVRNETSVELAATEIISTVTEALSRKNFSLVEQESDAHLILQLTLQLPISLDDSMPSLFARRYGSQSGGVQLIGNPSPIATAEMNIQPVAAFQSSLRPLSAVDYGVIGRMLVEKSIQACGALSDPRAVSP